MRRGRRSHRVRFPAGELVCAPLCPGPTLLQSFAGCELQAGQALAATFCFLIYVCLFSCRSPSSSLYLLQWLKSVGIIFVPLKKKKNSAGSFQHILFSPFAPPAQLLFLSSQITSESQRLVCSPAQGSRRELPRSNSGAKD